MTDTATNGAAAELLKPWTIDWHGARLSSADVTVELYAAAAMVAGADSWSLDPRSSPGNLLAWVIVTVVNATGRTVDDVRDEVGGALMVDLIGAVTTTEG
jgi:hypothetical protein